MKLEKPRVSDRSVDADILKFVSIIAVVFIHSCLLIPFNSRNLDEITPIFRFCVPIFIILWAYFMEKSIKKRNENYVLGRFIKLLIPFTFWSSVYFLFIANLGELTLSKAITKHWLGYGWAGQYYFIILFQLLPIFFLFRIIGYKTTSSNLIIFLSIIFYILIAYIILPNVTIINKLGDRPFLYWAPYVLLGIMYAKEKIDKPTVPLYIGIIAPFVIAIEYHYYYEYNQNLLSPYLLPSVFIASILLLKSVLGRKFPRITSTPWLINPINIISQNTLGIFCLNPLVIIFLSWTYKQIFSDGKIDFICCSFFLPVLSTILVTTLCLLVVYILKRINLGFLIKN